ncbi:hypothetical protein SAMN02745133_03039 [Desulforamulus putei DSM 12395]|uniref:Uncharacterized protein n=1 Tax=Desulforamulus putei DSM 12395 TaxID=1121429 RepID=A0A1M5CVU2_9FIRM|nr:hypothetical protein SAMN02745133_03039 [Desulforamulus putei DSM 12395]
MQASQVVTLIIAAATMFGVIGFIVLLAHYYTFLRPQILRLLDNSVIRCLNLGEECHKVNSNLCFIEYRYFIYSYGRM